MNDQQRFITGINYWPANKAMHWWRNFDTREVEQDFKRLAENRFQLVRIFLTWEDFQPTPETISTVSLDHLRQTADLAHGCGLQLMPTFFCGHMSGINWMPGWMLALGEGAGRFPVFSDDRIVHSQLRNCYTDPEVVAAQSIQIQAVATALNGHEAIFAYDLGNEASNWVVPPQRGEARKWLEIMTTQIKQVNSSSKVTLGMHAEDLEEDRRLWPQDVADFCDFLCMHGYPFYLSWVDDPLDPELVPFLAIITAWLGQKPVLFQEFGAPTRSVLPPISPPDYESQCQCPLWSEDEVAQYYQRVLQRLTEVGSMGGMAWCYADYAPSLWSASPLDKCRHERHFGIFRYDGTAKPAAEIFRHLDSTATRNHPDPFQISNPWLPEMERDKFYQHPQRNLALLYRSYKDWRKDG